MIKLISYGLKSGEVHHPCKTLIDVRHLKNPWADPKLRHLDGRDKRVQDFICGDKNYLNVSSQVKYWALKKGIVAVVCYGGTHRSVAVAELVADHLRSEGHGVEVEHLSLAGG